MAQANSNIESAKASLYSTLATRDELVEGFSAGVLMFGDISAWRDFRQGMLPGDDVEQLKQNLLVLGYVATDSFEVDPNFDSEAVEAIKNMQADLGVIVTGHIDFGDVVFLLGTSVVDSSQSFPNLSISVTTGSTLVSLTPIERIETEIRSDGTISTSTESLQRVSTTLEVASQDLIDIGSVANIELPDESVVLGTVIEIGSVAVVPQGGQSGNPYLEVSVAIDGDVSLPQWTGATVTVSITKKLASNVLAAPVTSLLALLDGGYALEIVESGSTRLVPVETGIYADGWVEVDGIGLDAGIEVIVPR